jgi:hypothetical protein
MHPVLAALAPIATVFATHYAAANVYSYVCAPMSFQGLITSLFTTASPVCAGILNVMTLSSQSYTLAVGGGLALLVSSVGMGASTPKLS